MRARLIALLLLCLSFSAYASHTVGGEITYKYLGETAAGSNYLVTLMVYEDCINGSPQAIASDNPARLSVFDAVTLAPVMQHTVMATSSLPVPANFSNSCITNYPLVCLQRTIFHINYTVPPGSHGYLVAYQTCCRNEATVNIIRPGEGGSTYFCILPPPGVLRNSSAVFSSYPPQIICLNNPLNYDNSATDADGDSLSYEICNALTLRGQGYQYGFPAPPPYDSVTWVSPTYGPRNPITAYPLIHLDPVTGRITGTPNRVGRYLIAVCCHEWREGVMINTITREFQFVVTDCSRTVVADMPQFSTEPNTYILNCTDYTVLFKNTSVGAYSHHWDFGVPGTTTDTSSAAEPVFTFPDTGSYMVRLNINAGGTCQDSISKRVKIYPTFRVAFGDTGNYCPGMPISFIDQSIVTIKPVTAMQWSFGDGATSTDFNPTHAYEHGGTYNTILIAQNIKGCADTTLRRIIIDNFKPYAGDDTVIVKGEHILFSAQGGIKYAWWPDYNLSALDIANPYALYPDTGHYSYNVQIESAYGCTGGANINVWVVDHASFFVPNAFSPNGDGLNDIFRPKAVGYKDLKFFRIVNRFGEEVYYGTTLEQGWDGTFNRHQADIGTYFWMISYTDRFGKDGFMKGDVTLIR